MKNKALLLSLSGVLLSGAAQADTLLGVYLGADGWQSAVTGSFANSEQLQRFNFNDKTQTSYYVALEHPLPLLPNIRLQHNALEAQGNTTLNANFSFAGDSFAASSTLRNGVDLTNTDYILYYEIVDNDLLSLDLGLNAKYIKGSVAVADTANSGAVGVQRASQLMPMLYSAAMIGLPLTGLDIFAQGSVISYDGSHVYDAQAGLAYAVLDNLAIDLRVKVGYRAVELQLDDIDDLYANIDFTGVFAGVELHF